MSQPQLSIINELVLKRFVGGALANTDICRTYGAWPLLVSGNQCYRTGLQSSAPPALHRNSQSKISNYELPITIGELSWKNSKNRPPRSRSAGGATQRSPACKGWGGKQQNSEHRTCATYRSRIVAGTQTL